jgi:hypothetical protein
MAAGCDMRGRLRRARRQLIVTELVTHRWVTASGRPPVRAGRHPATEADVRRGCVGNLTIRAAFTALPIDQLGTASPDMTSAPPSPGSSSIPAANWTGSNPAHDQGMHALRHTAASAWLSAAADIVAVAAWLGDTVETVYRTYALGARR